MSTWEPTYLKDLIPYLTNPNAWNYGMWNAKDPAIWPDGSVHPGEGGVDVTSPKGTPVLALATGPVLQAGYWNDQEHGVISQRINVPGFGVQDIYYQHIYLNSNIKPGMVVQKGQEIGTTGGFGEVELGFNANWGWPWGGYNHPGPWPKDPRPMLKALMLAGPPGSDPSGGAGSGTYPNTGSGGGLLDLTPISNALSALPGTLINDILGTDVVQRYILITIAGIIIITGVAVLFFSSDAGKSVEQDIKTGAEVAAV